MLKMKLHALIAFENMYRSKYKSEYDKMNTTNIIFIVWLWIRQVSKFKKIILLWESRSYIYFKNQFRGELERSPSLTTEVPKLILFNIGSFCRA